jgi:glycosyltransferase involved in cell wall biosynthesis
MDLSIVIPTYNEAENIGFLIPEIKNVAGVIAKNYEIIIIDGHSQDNTAEVARANGATVYMQPGKGYADALEKGLAAASGDYVITMDADFSHEPDFIKTMWEKRAAAELIIASRFISGGTFEQKGLRSVLSCILNKVSVWVLDLPIKDISSGFRMYHRTTFHNLVLKGVNYDILEEIVIRILCQGYKIIEVPLAYKTRKFGSSKAKLIEFAKSYSRTILSMWKLRNSIACADYDNRAYNSRIFLQRYWQRKRYQSIMGMIDDKTSLLDAGCGASKIIQDLPQAVGLDIKANKLRFLRSTNNRLIQGNILSLPFKDNTFKTVICSEVIEHLAVADAVFRELTRVLCPDGILIIGTPDYASFTWRTIGYIYEQYTRESLIDKLEHFGFRILRYDHILGSELIIKAQKK